MSQDVFKPDDEDVFLWPDGDWCYRFEHNGALAHRSDDFRVLGVGTCAYVAFEACGQDGAAFLKSEAQ
jgi:hypothetical protein